MFLLLHPLQKSSLVGYCESQWVTVWHSTSRQIRTHYNFNEWKPKSYEPPLKTLDLNLLDIIVVENPPCDARNSDNTPVPYRLPGDRFALDHWCKSLVKVKSMDVYFCKQWTIHWFIHMIWCNLNPDSLTRSLWPIKPASCKQFCSVKMPPLRSATRAGFNWLQGVNRWSESGASIRRSSVWWGMSKLLCQCLDNWYSNYLLNFGSRGVIQIRGVILK